MLPDGFTLSPLVATLMFVLAIIAGYQYRRIWKTDGAAWKAWLYGLTAGGCLLALGFLPVTNG